MISRIISGGQSGAERAALDVAIHEGIEHGGWCAAGRKANDGVIDTRYRLQEVSQVIARCQTRHNVQDSDGTLILTVGDLDSMTLAAMTLAVISSKPFKLIRLDKSGRRKMANEVKVWISENNIEVLNIAGSMESVRPGIYELAKWFVTRLLAGSEKLALMDEADEKKHRLALSMLNADLHRFDDDDELIQMQKPITLDDLPLQFVRRDRPNQSDSSSVTPDVVYTVTPDTGLVEWIRETNPDGSMTYGGYSAVDAGKWIGQKPVSEDLEYAIKMWAEKLCSLEAHQEQNTLNKTLADLHARGLVIAKQLKAELGRKARVIYHEPEGGDAEAGGIVWEIVKGGALQPIQNIQNSLF